MPDLFMIGVGAELLYTFDFSADVLDPAALNSVAFTQTGGVTLSSQYDDFANNRASIKVSGAAHGATYVVQAAGTTSTGEVIVKDITLQGFNA